jgi:hypothetical protein
VAPPEIKKLTPPKIFAPPKIPAAADICHICS